MKIEINDGHQPLFKLADSFSDPRNEFPQFSHTLIKAEDGQLSVSSGAHSRYITITTVAKVEKEGMALVPQGCMNSMFPAKSLVVTAKETKMMVKAARPRKTSAGPPLSRPRRCWRRWTIT